MKVYNLTDVATPLLAQHHMVEHNVLVGEVLLEPGASCDVPAPKEATVRAQLKHFINIGAVALDRPPHGYLQAHDALKAAPVKEPELVPSPEH